MLTECSNDDIVGLIGAVENLVSNQTIDLPALYQENILACQVTLSRTDTYSFLYSYNGVLCHFNFEDKSKNRSYESIFEYVEY